MDPSGTTDAAPVPVAAFKMKKKSRPAGLKNAAIARVRSTSPSGDAGPSSDSGEGSAVRKPQAKFVHNPLIQGTRKRVRKTDGLDGYSDDEDGVVDVNWKSSGQDKAKKNDFVTGVVDWGADEEEKREEERKKRKLMEDALNDGIPDPSMYQGLASYQQSLITPSREASTSKATRVGPVRASANIRQITVVDYQPDVCKDYKETGWCGFGDTCKFLHDRGDYMNGWQLDQQHERNLAEAGQVEEEEEEEVPFACLICRKEFRDPVVTKCGHFFDSDCAIKRFSKTPKCFACGQATGGIFNSATVILKKMEAKKAQRAKEKAEALGEEEEETGGGLTIEGEDDEE